MDKKARRLRDFPKPRYDEDIHLFHLPIDKELWKKFKTQCVTEGLTIREKLTSLVKSSLG